MEIDLIKQCADDRLTPAVIELFVDAVEAEPLSVKVTINGKAVLLPKIENAIQAADVLATHLGKAEIRFGVAQVSTAGFRPVEIGEYLFDPCTNLQIGSKQFAETYEKIGDGTTDETERFAAAIDVYLGPAQSVVADDTKSRDLAQKQKVETVDPNSAGTRVDLMHLDDQRRLSNPNGGED